MEFRIFSPPGKIYYLLLVKFDYDREEEEEEKINESNEDQDKLSYDTNFELYLYEQ